MNYKNLTLWLILGLVMILLFNLLSVPKKVADEVIFSDLITRLERGEIDEVIIKENHIAGQFKDGKKFRTYAPSTLDTEFIKGLMDKGVRITGKPPDENPWWVTFLLSWGPIIFIAAIWLFFMRQMQTGGNKALSFGKSKARLISDKSNKITFQDVAGIDEAVDPLPRGQLAAGSMPLERFRTAASRHELGPLA